MEMIELTKENIGEYIDECMEVQQYLLKSDEEIKKDQFIATASSTNSYFIAIIQDARVAGLGVVNQIVHPVRTNAYVDNIVVHPDFRGQGLFSIIMDNLEEKAKEWGAEGVKLTCSRENVQGMYEKRGYKEKTTTKYYVKKI